MSGGWAIAGAPDHDASSTGQGAAYLFAIPEEEKPGFVTGGGWIDSPRGAYLADTSLTGKAHFSFVVKNKQGRSTPDGNAQFKLKAGKLNFRSTSYDWLVVSGAKAMFQGSGTLNGAGNYGFMFTAVDAAISGSTSVDLFRIKIWDKDSGNTLLYDNGLGADDNTGPTAALRGGSIVIHTPKGKN